MEEAYLFDGEGIDIANGRYIVLGEGGKPVAQSDDFSAVVDKAWAKGITHPAVVDLEITLGYTYVF